MKKIIFIILFFISITSLFAQNKNKNLGIGVILGEPTGLSLKVWTKKTQAFDAALACSFGYRNSMHIHMDYLFHEFNSIKVEKGSLPFYYGIGARILIDDVASLGVRIPVGLTYLFENSPVDIFLELVPVLNLNPVTNFNLNGAVGARFYIQ